jgi:hypothetical protein
VSFAVDADECHSDFLADLAAEAQDEMEYAVAVTDLVRAFLNVDANLFNMVLAVCLENEGGTASQSVRRVCGDAERSHSGRPDGFHYRLDRSEERGN